MKKLLLLLAVTAFFSCKNENQVQETAVTPESVVSADTVTIENTGNELAFNRAKTVLKWSAYKTPEKVAVHGSFDSIRVNNTNTSLIPEEILEGADFTITTSSMTTGDISRDGKIIGLFFHNLSNPYITGKFGKFENQVVPITLNMNDVEVTKDFSYTFENRKIIITGVIDMVSDFKADTAFGYLHEACAALHMDKTWTDVSIEVISDFGN